MTTWPARQGRGEIWLDVTRILEMACLAKLSGIDRVELAYAIYLGESDGGRTRYVARSRTGRHTMLDTRSFLDFAQALDKAWGEGALRAVRLRSLALVACNLAGRPLPPSQPGQCGPVYLVTSHRHLDKPHVLQSLLARTAATFILMIHDLIPIEFPEYVTPGGERTHARRISTVSMMADGIIANSSATLASLQPFLRNPIPSVVAHLGTRIWPAPVAAARANHPYFVFISTIEPRKNHIMLLHMWRRMASELGAQTPRLVLIGRMGWESEQVIDLLQRSPAIRAHVEHRIYAGDAEIAGLLVGARALLLPSFAEGYGMPVAEALASGTPVICSNIPALREVGLHIPDYLDPNDGLGWHAAVVNYTDTRSTARIEQLRRMTGWQAPTWEGHFAKVGCFIDAVRQNAVRSRT